MDTNKEGQDASVNKNPDPAVLGIPQNTASVCPNSGALVNCENYQEASCSSRQVDPLQLAGMLGVSVNLIPDMGPDDLDVLMFGPTANGKGKWHLVINPAVQKDRQRAAAAWAIARYLMNTTEGRSIFIRIDDTISVNDDPDPADEPQARELAAYLLDPNPGIKPELLHSDHVRARLAGILERWESC